VTSSAQPGDVRIEMLGRFRVVVDGREAAQWPTRRSQELVQLLALAGGRRVPRDRVIEQLWPHLGAEAGAANLRKAAHHARRTLGDPGGVVLRGGLVELFPARSVETDVASFLRDAAAALADGDPGACARAATGCPGELLPDAAYEAWAQDPRRQVRAQHAALLRRCGDWERLVEVEPTEEPAYRELMRAALAAGSRHAALRWYERLRLALASQLGARPDPETQELYERCTSGIGLVEHAFVGRAVELAAAMAALTRARAGETSALVLRGPPGIGKVRARPRDRAPRAGGRVARGAHVRDGAGRPVRAAVDRRRAAARRRAGDPRRASRPHALGAGRAHPARRGPRRRCAAR
jgi:DNA-binding SARP family transcriptional activator